MKINLFSPENNQVVSLIPKRQTELMAALPDHEGEILETLDWANPKTLNNGDNTLPRHILFTFGYEGSMEEVYGVDFYLSQNADFEDADVYEIAPFQTFISIPNLLRNKTYYWKMVAEGESEPVAESETYRFTTAADMPQWYYLEGSTNIRDIGGLIAEDGKEIKTGLLIRGAQTDRTLKINHEARYFLRHQLKIKSVLDLRLETEEYPEGRLPYGEIPYHISSLAYGEFFDESENETTKKIFTVLADKSNYPIYMHCHAGCDRTGTVAFLLEALLGCKAQDIANDYELSSLSIFGTRSRYSPDFIAMLGALGKFGPTPADAAKNYLLSCGITEEQIASLKDIFLG
ncbi:MAG: tyrosine-protein phosphatase [Clostridiales bacterium]|nr:tyrosine-protein phosphatase [Candidatus Equinaster intestinalis]